MSRARPWTWSSHLRLSFSQNQPRPFLSPLRPLQHHFKAQWHLQHRNATTTSTTQKTPSISPTLLARARSTQTEHTRLTTLLSTSYSASTAKQLGTLTRTTTALSAYETALSSHEELTTLTQSDDPELRSLAAEDLPSSLSALESAIQNLTNTLIPPHPFAHHPCLLEIRPGAGGSEAALFAGDLLRMYTSYCARIGYKTTLLKYEDAAGGSNPDISTSNEAPLTEAILEIVEPGSYGALRLEAGVHRVQRVPATESKGRTHTSAASVLVLPSLPSSPEDSSEEDTNDPNSDYYVSTPDVRVDVMRARGAGGQHVNTTDSAVRLTHTPTGTVITCQDSRSQIQNRAKAWQILRSRLAALKREAREEEADKLRQATAGHGKSGRGDKVRTYNWGQSRVTDHRSGVSVSQLGDLLEGGEALERLMESVRGWEREREVEGMMVEEEVGRKERAK